jgi:hypothetical protein
MGMYTRLVLNVSIRDDGSGFVDTIKRMVECNANELPGRLSWMFGSSSYYHDNINVKSIVFDDIDKEWKLSVVCDLKNYENEIRTLLNMLAPHVVTSRCAGYYLYEECDSPTLFWFIDDKLVEFTPELPRNLLEENIL